jgi:hypothetical protein
MLGGRKPMIVIYRAGVPGNSQSEMPEIRNLNSSFCMEGFDASTGN